MEFQYCKYQNFYFWARHAVDDNNHNRSAYLSLEDAVNTKSWTMRQFTFIDAVSEVNACLSYNYFVRRPKKLPFLSNTEFRRIIVKSMVTNSDWRNDALHVANAEGIAQDCLLKHYTKGQGEWSEDKGEFKLPSHPYQKFRCKFGGGACKRLVRTYCLCNPKLTMCNMCFGYHIAENTKQSTPTMVSPAVSACSKSSSTFSI